MKYLSNVCILLWLIPYFGKQFFPDVFSVWYIQWTSFGLLSILLPYGFAKSILNKAENKFTFIFLFLFLVNMFLTGVGLNLLKTANTFLTVQTELIPENTSLAAINNDNPEVRRVVAQMIYKEFGQPIMFKNKLDKLIVYKPTDEDKINFRERFTTGAKAKEIIRSTSRQISEIMYLFGWACSCFLIIFMITFRLDQCKANKAFKQDK
jgi:fucose permease